MIAAQLFLFGLALVLRAWAAAARRGAPGRSARALAVGALVLAACPLSATAGALVAVGGALVVAFVAGAVALPGRPSRLSWPALDGLALALFLIWGDAWLAPGRAAALVVVWVGVGAALDRVIGRSPGRLVAAGVAASLATLAAVGFLERDRLGEIGKVYGRSLVHVAPVVETRLVPIELANGTTGWLRGPPGRSPQGGAVLLHGAHPMGSMQAPAVALRQALLRAGRAVLSVDHVGYGASPPPPVDARMGTWDPMRGAVDGARRLRERLGVERLLVVGHSMGGTDALRLTAAAPELVEATVVLGVGPKDGPEKDAAWYLRFHEDRGLRGRLPVEFWVQLRRSFYDPMIAARELGPDHPPIVVVRMGKDRLYREYPEDPLLSALPGSVATHHLASSTHYLNAHRLWGFTLVDVSLVRALAEWFSAPGSVGTEQAVEPVGERVAELVGQHVDDGVAHADADLRRREGAPEGHR